MIDPSLVSPSDPKIPPPPDTQDPEAPHLTDLDDPALPPGTDIVPPDPTDPPERREGVVSDPDVVPTSATPA